jgi:hypothetical protein
MAASPVKKKVLENRLYLISTSSLRWSMAEAGDGCDSVASRMPAIHDLDS